MMSQTRPAARARMTLALRQRLAGWSFAGPGLVVLLLVVAVPLVLAFLLAFSSYTFLHTRLPPFLGLANIAESVNNPYFWHSMWLTVAYSVVTVAGEILLGMAIALLLNQELRGKGIYYAILTVPMAMAPVSVALIWHMLLQPNVGIVNHVLGIIGLPQPDWLGSIRLAFWSVVLVDIWQQVSFVVLILTAGLSALPVEPYEAAAIDGASTPQRFFYLTLPLIRPVATVAVIIQLINEFRAYDLFYVLTKGGPGVSTDVLSYFIYRTAFLGLNINEAAASSFGLLIVVLALTVAFYMIVIRRAD
jgi:multiple sugar transport system permease protein